MTIARLLPLVALVAIGSGSAHPPQVAFRKVGGTTRAILLTDQGGANAVDLTAGKPHPAALGGYSWAPDGSRLVYVGNEQTLGGDLEVVDVDARTAAQITSKGANEHAVWSPDGSRIAYIHTVRLRDGHPPTDAVDVWAVAPDGSGDRQVTHDGAEKYALGWTPDGADLIVASGSGSRIVDPATGRVLRSSKDGMTFSPDGKRVALTSAGGTIDVANADGSGRHRVAGNGAGGPTWSPDGTQIAFTRFHCTPGFKGLCGSDLDSIYVVGADGGGERRLTGPLGGPGTTDDGFPYDFSYGPVWWPDGKQLFFQESHATGALVMNADGTCEHRIGPDEDVSQPSWRPGADPTLPPRRCVDLRVRAVARKSNLGVHEPGRVDVVVENDGNETATGVTLALRIVQGRPIRAPSRLGSLAPGGSRRLVATVVPGPGWTGFQVKASVSAVQPSTGSGDSSTAYFHVLAGCDVAGTDHADRLTGTPRVDRICALPGNDVIRAGAGNDTIDAGAGYDRIYPGPGRDRVDGGEGRDTIYANDGQRDTIDCGPYLDTLYIDKLDVFRNCERVHLR